MGKENKMHLLGEAPIPKALLALGIPTMIGMMINALYNLVDAFFVGGLGTSQLGAISVAFPLGQVVVGMGLLFGNGAASYISRLLGKENKEKANQAACTALYSSLTAGAVLIVLSLIFLRPILQMLGATEHILPYARTYTMIIMAASIFNILNVTMNNIVTSEGAAKMTMYVLMAGAALNMVLDPLFIYVLHMGIAGAALATAIAQMLSSGIYVAYILNKKSIFSFRWADCRFTKDIFSEIMKIGVPTLIFQLLTSLAVTLINMRAKAYGDSVIAGMGAVTRLISMGSLMVFGFIKGFQPIAGYSYGAKKYARLKEAIRTSVIWATAFCTVYGVAMAILAPMIIASFTKGDAEMVQVGTAALRANGLSFVVFGFSTVYSSLFLALGKAKAGFLLGLLRQGICFVPMIVVLPIFLGVNGILYAQPVSDALAAAITVLFALSFYKELSKAESKLPCVQEASAS